MYFFTTSASRAWAPARSNPNSRRARRWRSRSQQLVELGLQCGQSLVFLGAELTLLQKPVLLIGQPLNMREHGSNLVWLSHGLSSVDPGPLIRP